MLGRYEEAIESCNEAIKIKSDYSDALFTKGNAFRDLGRKLEALECYNKSLKFNSDYVTYCNKGSILYDSGKYEEAIDCYNEAIDSYNEAIKFILVYINNPLKKN